MRAPFISICIPAYRAERFLAETLESVRAQTFADWELIVTEDGSRDRTEELTRAFAATVSQSVRYTRHDPNRGLPATRNAGIAEARGEWIALLDADDLWEPEHLASLAKAAEQTGAELVHAGSVLFDSDTGRELEVRAPSARRVAEFPRSLFFNAYSVQPASVLLRRELWARVGGFNPEYRYVEDREMWMRCARAGAKFHYTGKNTCRYRKHGAALSTHAAEMAEAGAAVFEQHLDWEEIPKEWRVRLTAENWAAAGQLRFKTRPALAARHFARAYELGGRPEWRFREMLARLLAGWFRLRGIES